MSRYINSLFAGTSIDEWLAARHAAARSAVASMPADRLLRAPVDDLVEEVVAAHIVGPFRLRTEDQYTTGAREGEVDISRDPMRAVSDRSRPFHVRSTVVDLHVPFDGDPQLLDCRPNTFDTGGGPHGVVQGGEVVLTVQQPTDALDNEGFKRRLQAEASRLVRYAEWLQPALQTFPSSLAETVRQAVTTRRSQLDRDSSLEQSLGVPVRRRSDPHPALNVDVPRRRPLPVAPQPRRGYAAEPAISEVDYAAVVEMMVSARRIIERQPETFSTLPEESLRDIVLVILNNQFGSGTAETFSGAGKTDILIQSGTGAVFITECKKWRGEVGFAEAIDQLLGYLVWRDTKAALLIFVRNADVTGVATKAAAALRAHATFKRESTPIAGEPAFVLHHSGDREREITIALLIVPIPHRRGTQGGDEDDRADGAGL